VSVCLLVCFLIAADEWSVAPALTIGGILAVLLYTLWRVGRALAAAKSEARSHRLLVTLLSCIVGVTAFCWAVAIVVAVFVQRDWNRLRTVAEKYQSPFGFIELGRSESGTYACAALPACGSPTIAIYYSFTNIPTNRACYLLYQRFDLVAHTERIEGVRHFFRWAEGSSLFGSFGVFRANVVISEADLLPGAPPASLSALSAGESVAWVLINH
jgi:hypothetical protein